MPRGGTGGGEVNTPCEMCKGTGEVHDGCADDNCCPSNYPCPMCGPRLPNFGAALNDWREIRNLRAALAHERDRARRVVRIYWVVRYAGGHLDVFDSRSYAWHDAHRFSGRVYRVTVRRVVSASRRGTVGS